MRIIQISNEKEWIGVDLDGTLAEYTSFKGVDQIGKPVSKMLSRVKRWIKDGKKVKIFTARASGKDKNVAIKAIKKWCKEHIGKELEVTCEKDCFMTALWDDRAVQVEKNVGEKI